MTTTGYSKGSPLQVTITHQRMNGCLGLKVHMLSHCNPHQVTRRERSHEETQWEGSHQQANKRTLPTIRRSWCQDLILLASQGVRK